MAYRRIIWRVSSKLGALGCASPELLAPLSDLVPHQASLLNSLVALKEYSAKDASIVTQLSIEIKHRFLSYLWNIVLSSRDLPMRGIESGQAITLLNWAGVSMNADSLAKMGIKDLRGVRIVDADLSYADLSGVDMSGADCQGLRCCFANLKGVSWQGANLNNLKLLESLPLIGHTEDVGCCANAGWTKGISGSEIILYGMGSGEGGVPQSLEGHTDLCGVLR